MSAERQRGRMKLIVAGFSAVALAIVVAVGAVAIYQYNRAEDESRSDGSGSNTAAIHSTSKSIEAICSSTDYKNTCTSSLSKAMNKTGKASSGGDNEPEPMDLVKGAINVITEGIEKAFTHSRLVNETMHKDDPMVKGAVDDCMELYAHAKDELQRTVDSITKNGLEDIPTRSHELRNWLSAVISYQETCIDGFPEGEFKTAMKKAFKASKELTSNAMAIISEAASILSVLDIKGLNLRRRLLADDAMRSGTDSASLGGQVHDHDPPLLLRDEDADIQRDSDGMPAWIDDDEDGNRDHPTTRRLLSTGNWKSKMKPNVVVAKDGSGDFKTITDALAAMPKPEKYEGKRYVIHVREGVYDESPMVTKKMVNVTMYGDGAKKTIVTGSKNFVDGTRTFMTATFAAIGEGFMALGMGFRNTAGSIKHQAVALRVQSDRAVFFNCRMEGYQDTLYAQTHRQFYRSCVIAGTVDFIFGDSTAVFQNSVIVVRRPLDNQQNIVTAHGRIDRHEPTGFVIQNCRIVADKKLKPDVTKGPMIKSYLARPWKECSRTVFMESSFEDFISPQGYLPWDGDFGLKTLYYAEFNNKGPGAELSKRVKWPGYKAIHSKDAAKEFISDNFIQGGEWIKRVGVPVHLGFYH